jgi:DNA-binding CsgD family transcriptional regulator
VPRIQLTRRQEDVLRLAAGGASNSEIAARLKISPRTVEAHMSNLYHKTGVKGRAQLCALYRAGGLSAELAGHAQGPNLGDGQSLTPAPQRLDVFDPWRELRRYAAAVRGLVDRQHPLFEERVEITLLVGEQDGQDSVVEKRWTRPRPYLVYRILGPIIAMPEGVAVEPEDLRLVCNLNGQDTQVGILPVRDADGRLLTMILFQPGLSTETEWVLTYRSPKLWSPLRDTGRDSLTWATATLDQRHPATLTDLTVKVVFPPSWTGENLAERSGLGTIRRDRLATGQTQLTWHHDSPHAGAYHWLLLGSPST